MKIDVGGILSENERRHRELDRVFDPVSGEGSIGERFCVELPHFPLKRQWLPATMCGHPLLTELLSPEPGMSHEEMVRLYDRFVRLRMQHDFPFWCATAVYIKRKGGGDDTLFRLNRPQRKFVERLEAHRLAGRPIRLILLKARQWGGSTCSQLYMAWLQLIHRKGLNSLIIAHQGSGSDEIKDMFDRMIRRYPVALLADEDGEIDESAKKIENVGKSGSIVRVPARNCKIKVGTAERPDSCRGGDYNLVHCSEVGIWKATAGKSPEMILRSAGSGVLLAPMTMIIYESTANGTGNFFHREYEAAKRGESQFESMFISWFDIEQYSTPLADAESFAAMLLEGRHAEVSSSSRRESGKYLWGLWEKGATLEAINWYIGERSKYGEHALMASEYPSDDMEAFVHSGNRVFERERVERLRETCCRGERGEVSGAADEGKGAVKSVKFTPMAGGALEVWHRPEEGWRDRYLTVVDVGGRSRRSDWSVIAVFDRRPMADGEPPEIVAQWRGHVDIDRLAWKAAAIAQWYCESLLVFESNTLESRDADRDSDTEQTPFIFCQLRDVYFNLYARGGNEYRVNPGAATRYGFHTNSVTKPMVIAMLVRCVREGLYVEREEGCVDELLQYEKRHNGSYGAITGCHDDMLMTRAIGLHICFNEMPLPSRIYPRSRDRSMRRRGNAIF